MSRRNYLGSILIANKHKLNNLVIMVDYNQIQALQKIKDVLPLNNLSKSLNHLI